MSEKKKKKKKKKTWLITGAGRGMGVEFVRAVLASGDAVVATGRDPEAVANALDESDDLLTAKLDVTSSEDAEAAAQTAVDRFGGIDVLVNNAGNFYAGFFEELSAEQIEKQFSTTLLGPMNVTRAVLPIMRKQGSGHVITISSTAGLVGTEFGSAYSASKFGIEGWMRSLAPEIEPFGIATTIVNPGFFRTELLRPESTSWSELSMEDYAERDAAQRKGRESQDGKQTGDPAKLAEALVAIAGEDPPPTRFMAGADAVETAEQAVAELREQFEGHRELSSSLALNEDSQ